MIGWLIAAAALYLFLNMKAGIRLRWESGEAKLKLRVGILRFSLSTSTKKETKDQKNTDTINKSKGKNTAKPGLKKWVRALIAHWRELLALVSRVLRLPKLDLMRLHIAAGGKDAEGCAMNYGRICAGLSAVLPIFLETFAVKKQDIDVSCCFDRTDIHIFAEVEAIVRIYEILGLLGSIAGLLFKFHRHTKISEKAVQYP